jgi:hypothetical protein
MSMRSLFLVALGLIGPIGLGQSDTQSARTELDKDRKLKRGAEMRLMTTTLDKAQQRAVVGEIEHLVREIDALESKDNGQTRSRADQRVQDFMAKVNMPISGGDVLGALEQGVLVSSDFKKTADGIADPFVTTLETYDKLAGAITGNQKPEKPTTPYSIDSFAARVDQAADILVGLPLNPDVDASKYSVSLSQLASCVTQDSSLDTLHSYASAMDTAIGEAQSNVDYLNKFRQAVAQLNSAAQTFSKAAAIAASTPDLDWTEYFSSAWWDLDQHLAPAIAHLDNAAAKQISQITNNINRLKLQADNLRSNLQLLKPNWCILGGSWSGQCIVDQFQFIKMASTLTLTNNGSQGGNFTMDGKPMGVQSVSISGKVNLTVTFGLPGVPARTEQGSFDSTYQHFTGKTLIPGSPGLTSTCRLAGSGY